jgi:hypothetical protein
MSIPVSNLDQAEAWSAHQPLDLGWNNVTCLEPEEGQSGGGHPAIRMRFEDREGKSLKNQLVVIESTYGKVLQFLNAINVQPQGGDWDLAEAIPSFAGRKLRVFVVEKPGREDPSKTFREVEAYDVVNGQSTSDIPADTAGMGVAAAMTRDDDIPF